MFDTDLDSAVSHDQKNNLAGSIARALAVFSVDEIVIFDDEDPKRKAHPNGSYKDDGSHYTGYSDPSHFLIHLLSYLETPPYLRRALFPMHPDLKTAGSLPSLDMPHHSKVLEGCAYREGVTVNYEDQPPNKGTWVDVGLEERSLLPDVDIPAKTRVTVKYSDESHKGEAVAPTAPREEAGYYWGYSIRRCSTLSTVFTECPFDGGYDLSFGTSERGTAISDALSQTTPPPFSHMLVVFGGPPGLEVAAKSDSDLVAKSIGTSNVGDLFDYWVNILPDQGSRTIRTEEAVWLGLMGLRGVVVGNG